MQKKIIRKKMQRKNFQKFCRNVKERRYLLIGTIAIVISFFTYYCFYIFSSARNIVFQDHFRYLEIADKVVNGRLDITYLWLSFSGHRSPINLLTFLLNAKYFHLNTKIPANANSKLNLPPVQIEKYLEDKYNFPFCEKILTKTTPIF